MLRRKLGNSGLEVAPLCFGGNVFGWTVDEKQSFDLLDAFVSAGFNFIDTADVYSKWSPGNKGGESETILGKWFKTRGGQRGKIVLATKVGYEMAPDKKGLSRRHIIAAVDESLKRLQTEYIDLYQSHVDDETVPQEETLEAYQTLVKSGKVRAIGASNFTAARLKSAIETAKKHGLPSYVSLQPEYNLYDREGYETELEPICRANNIGVINYYALARGFLSGKYRLPSDAGKSPRGEKAVATYLNPRGYRILQVLDELSAKLKSTPSQISLAWLMARPGITAPIASATKLEHLQDFMKAVNLNLEPEHIQKLDEASKY
jgi:aryl-alcohol dehydrogenase-like predicted oxidoreductase